MKNGSLCSPMIQAFLYAVPLAFVFNVFLVTFSHLFMGGLPSGKNILGAFDLTQSEILVITLVHFGFAFLQAFLLVVPVIPNVSLSKQPHALWPRVGGAAFLCSLAIAILLGALIDILEFTPYGDWSTVKIFLKAVCVIWILSWLIWCFVIWKASRQFPETVEKKAWSGSGWSLVGLALCLPWYWILRKKESCACSLATFYALIAGIMSLLIVGGPLLLVLGRDRKIKKIFDPKSKRS